MNPSKSSNSSVSPNSCLPSWTCGVENPDLPFWVPLVCWGFETVLRTCAEGS